MAHDHDSHSHSHTGNERAVGIAAVLTGGFMMAEVVGGIVSGSLALLADAGHMLTDFGSLLLAWFAFRLARRPADWKRTYGFDRFSVLAAFVNGITLFAIAAWIVIEAARRLMNPSDVTGDLMLGVALGGLVVNLLAFWILTRDESDNLNVRAAALHVMGDLLGSVAAIAASLIIIFTGWMPIDPILSVLVALLILRSAYKVVKESGHILLEGSPRDFDSREVAQALRYQVPGVAGVAHIHAWSITQERPMATLEAAIEPGADEAEAKAAIKKWLHDEHGIEHVTVEMISSNELKRRGTRGEKTGD
ncbi:cation diffusion facilitator family transporter [Parvularcula sp. LCG005]|uniref:cation diffusion facilitator family transporter n=1 Tax=Parvularcula sp. LCG005 TaxID=3078805 RepID=UPI002942F576|nr:cation diffusion facilitator family transporter [Parvularcula sp. LCG005]WOI52981.1 cation diffusion facilitator family transporter [Parvularcula sp. LCG005]